MKHRRAKKEHMPNGVMFIALVICAPLLINVSPGRGQERPTQSSVAGHMSAPASFTVRPLKLPSVSTAMWESHPAIDPLTGDLWFVRSDTTFSGWRLQVSRCKGGRLQVPRESPFAGAGIEADPYFSKDGKDLYYISSRASGSHESSGLDIWHVSRTSKGEWLQPERLPAPVNSEFAEWFPRPASDGWLYFGSRRPGGFGKDDIWRARPKQDGTWAVENAGVGINTVGSEYEFLPSPDGSWALLSTDNGIYRVDRGPNGWVRGSRLGNEINANGTEIGPFIFNGGEGFLFSRDAGNGTSGELFVAFMATQSRVLEGCPSLQRTINNAFAETQSH